MSLSPETALSFTGTFVRRLKRATENDALNRKEPVYVIPRRSALRSEKADTIYREGILFGREHSAGEALATVTTNPSPHTLSEIPRREFIQASSTIFHRDPSEIQLPFVNIAESIPSHLIVWWLKKKQQQEKLERIDTLRLARLSDAERRDFLSVIHDSTVDAVNVLKHSKGMKHQKQNKRGTREIEIYGLFGHATPDEIRELGLGRGPQSSPEGHLNVTVFDPEKRKDKMRSDIQLGSREKLKQYGILDSILFEYLRSSVRTAISNTAKERLKGIAKVDVKDDIDYKISHDMDASPRFEGYTLEFKNEKGAVKIPMTSAMEVVLDVVKQFDAFYEGLTLFYEAYYKHLGDAEGTAQVIHELREFADSSVGFHQNSVDALVYLFKSIKPTYMQINRWMKDLEEEQTSIDTLPYKALSRMRQKCLSLSQDLADPIKRASMKDRIKRLYKITDFEADVFLRFTGDRLVDTSTEVDAYKQIEFVFPRFLSGSYLLGNHSIENGDLQVGRLSLATRVGSTKGVAEDLMGITILRDEQEGTVPSTTDV